MKQTEYLPLGSIVVLKGGVKKLMIIARGLAVKIDGVDFYVAVLKQDGKSVVKSVIICFKQSAVVCSDPPHNAVAWRHKNKICFRVFFDCFVECRNISPDVIELIQLAV